jgi:transcription-repair coupling factor (superfamily II helicase)
VVQGVLNEGFELIAPLIAPNFPIEGKLGAIRGNVLVLSDAELFGYARLEPRRLSEKRATPTESFYADLNAGDYVVHIEHGIAKYAGLTRRDFNYGEREYLLLSYAEGDKLFVPIDQADRVARYMGMGAHAPHLNRLGTTDWEQVKAKAKRAVDDIAEELIELYAKRAQIAGHTYSADSDWQRELENSFPYTETADQLRALTAIKRDMEAPKPMDRLICGDVGYGKTEVALRAAFKAVNDGKQVAVLVPTTVLAEQHLKTFTQRLKPFPVEVEMLSRFRTESQQKKILERLQQGSVDIVIGTHRLLQDDVQFKELGLLIIDEEQRFGVKAKEKLKQFRTAIDVLTMTATPIPRTLNMALMGARDMSTIDTPPEERLPIRTYVTPYDEAVIKQAILRELGRGGQVFFVHNRVQGIEQVRSRLQRLVPDARIAVGHGQMKERELERVMIDFDEGKYDVLVCTAIIESGIDLPNVNTIIVNRADQFGLSDLYQLRGRVGRSNKQSYAYLMYSRDKVLVDVARKRLQAIFEASELGAGFKIAMRDMEIRGAGDILGARQHGHIAAVGFDLYTKLLAQAIQERRETGGGRQKMEDGRRETGDGRRKTGDEESRTENRLPSSVLRPPSDSVTLDLPLEAHIPSEYVAQEEMRLRLYRRMAELTSLEAVEEFAQELKDRFGPVPQATLHLLYLVRVKVWALQAGIEAIVYDPANDRITVRVRERMKLLEWRPSREVEKAVSVWRNTVTIGKHGNLGEIRGNKGDGDWREVLEEVVRGLAT